MNGSKQILTQHASDQDAGIRGPEVRGDLLQVFIGVPSMFKESSLIINDFLFLFLL